jgi:hypothetical protein
MAPSNRGARAAYNSVNPDRASIRLVKFTGEIFIDFLIEFVSHHEPNGFHDTANF